VGKGIQSKQGEKDTKWKQRTSHSSWERWVWMVYTISFFLTYLNMSLRYKKSLDVVQTNKIDNFVNTVHRGMANKSFSFL